MGDNSQRKKLFIINEGPYGNERAYNALRLALNVAKRPGVAVCVFLTGDGVQCAGAGSRRRRDTTTWRAR